MWGRGTGRAISGRMNLRRIRATADLRRLALGFLPAPPPRRPWAAGQSPAGLLRAGARPLAAGRRPGGRAGVPADRRAPDDLLRGAVRQDALTSASAKPS